MGDDRRCDPRQPAEHLKARVRFADRKQLERCYLKDISRGGIFLRTPKPGPLDAHIEVTLELPGGQQVTLNGTIVHRLAPDEVRGGQQPGIGVQFSDLTASVRQTLEALVTQLSTPEADPAPAPGRPLPVRTAPAPARATEFEDRKTDPRGPRKPATTALLPDEAIIEEGFEDEPPPVASAGAVVLPHLQPPARPAPPPAEAPPAPPPTRADRTATPPGLRAAVAAGASRVTLDTLRRLLWRFADAGRLAGHDYYDIIGVARAASIVEIRASCEAMRRAFDLEHPPELLDPGMIEQVAAVVSLIGDIEQCLCDPRRRQTYDRTAPGAPRR